MQAGRFSILATRALYGGLLDIFPRFSATQNCVQLLLREPQLILLEKLLMEGRRHFISLRPTAAYLLCGPKTHFQNKYAISKTMQNLFIKSMC